MTDDPSDKRRFTGPALFYGLLLLFFLQLCSDFVETIYAFGLMNVDIPPEVVSVALFFSPALLFFWRRGLPARVNLLLMGVVALVRLLDVFVTGGAKMIASGLGVGTFLLLLPSWLARRGTERDEESAEELGGGLLLALGFSIFLRALGTGSDLLPAQSGLGWLNVLLPVYFLIMLGFTLAKHSPAEQSVEPEHPPHARPPFGTIAALCLGLLNVLAVLYFALSSPAVLTRWTELDYRLVLLFLGTALAVYAALLPTRLFEHLSNLVVLVWNLLFTLCGTAAILLSTLPFPADPAAYPLDQPPAPLAAHIALVGMLLLSPGLALGFTRLARGLVLHTPSPRALAGGFTIGAFFFLVVVLAQAFTTVYDYIPVIGPLWRDRFWLVFALAGLGATLPLLVVPRLPSRARGETPLSGAAFPLLVSMLVITVIWSVWRAPRPPVPVPSARVRVLTFNIQQGYDIYTRRAYEAQLAAIRALDADIIGLQESDTARFSGGNGDLVRTLAEGLDMYVYYGPRTVTGTFGIALLSRYPIENPRTFFMFSSGEQTAALQAEIAVEGTLYHILVTHLGNGGPIIQQQQILEKLAGQENIIAMGDFNFRPSTEQYALTVQSLQDAWVLGGETPTEGLDPQRRIDHVFVSPGVQVYAARYISDPVSDHPALLVEITP